MFRIRGGSKGITIKRYVVVPAGSMIPFFGIRCGSYATDAVVTFGDSTSTIQLDAHQQKIVELKPHNWTTNTVQQLDKQKVQIIPLTISLPHDDVWLSILATQKERDVFTLFGGGIEGKSLHAPLKEIPAKQEKQYFDALSHLRYLETSPSRKIKAGERIAMWELPLPAGHYKLTCEVEGLADSSIIELELVDAKGKGLHLPKQRFQIKEGLQRIEYLFSKPFAPYQSHLVVSSRAGNCTMISFKLTPDYHEIANDLELWRRTGIKPKWVARFSEQLYSKTKIE